MSISADQVYLLNRMNTVASQVQLGTLIQNAENVTAGEIALADGSLLVGNSSGVGAAVTPSGDVTITNAGVTAIGAGKVLETMLVAQGTVGLHAERVAVAQYSFAVSGGAVSSISLTTALPARAIITQVTIEVLTAFTSTGGTGTIALTSESAADLLAAVDADTLNTGLNNLGVPRVATPSTWVKTTAARTLTLVVATAALTAGKANFYVHYMVAPS